MMAQLSLTRALPPTSATCSLGPGPRSTRRLIAAVRCQVARADGSGHVPPCKGPLDPHALRGATLLLAAALTAQAAQPAAAAARGLPWEPRRHYRRLPRIEADVEEVEDAQQAAVVQQSPTGEQQAAGSLQSQFTEMQRSVGLVASAALDKVHTGVETASSALRSATGGDGVTQYTETVASPPRGLAPSRGVGVPAAGEWLGLAASVAGGGLALWLLVRKLLPAIFGASRLAQGGRWVRDRGLGGKEVFVADDPSPSSRAASPAEPAKRRQTRLPDTWGMHMPESGTRVITAGGRRRPSGLAAEPEWWSEPRPPMYVHPSQKEQGLQAAKRILRGLEDSKLAGRSYTTSAIVELRETCQSAGVSGVPANTESGRDSIFRASVNAALGSALESGKLAGMRPQQFVAGVAHDLGVPTQRAVQIVHAEVASRVRTMIINACAARRAGNTPEEMNQLLRLAGLLTSFPLLRGSAEGEVIASSIAARCWLSERQAVFLTYGAMEPGTASLMAELLGFDPELVLPQLEMYTREK